MKSASAEMNVHSWQGLVAGTCGHQTRHLDQRSAQNPKCIVLLAKMSLQDFTTSSGQKDLHAWSSMHVLVRGSNRILISHTLIYGDSVTRLCCLCCCCILLNLHVRGAQSSQRPPVLELLQKLVAGCRLQVAGAAAEGMYTVPVH